MLATTFHNDKIQKLKVEFFRKRIRDIVSKHSLPRLKFAKFSNSKDEIILNSDIARVIDLFVSRIANLCNVFSINPLLQKPAG